MQVILTEEEYNTLKMQVESKVSTPDHIILQNNTIKVIDGFQKFCNAVKREKPEMFTPLTNPLGFEGILDLLISTYKEEVQSHFVR